MKFGKNLLSHQIPQWLAYYINYKGLKKIIKQISSVLSSENSSGTSSPNGSVNGSAPPAPKAVSAAARAREPLEPRAPVPTPVQETDPLEAILLAFFFELDRNVETVDEFYLTKLTDYAKRLKRVVTVLAYSPTSTRPLGHPPTTKDDVDELVLILLELRLTLRNLEWFGEINYKGFVKILKKLDKKLGTEASHQESYLSARINPLPFAQGAVRQELDTIQAILAALGADADDEDVGTPSRDTPIQRLALGTPVLDLVELLVLANDPEECACRLREVHPAPLVRALTALLVKATVAGAVGCIDVLVKELERGGGNPFVDKSDITGRSFFHQLMLALGKNPKEALTKYPPAPPSHRMLTHANGPDSKRHENAAATGISHILDKFQAQCGPVLISRDLYQRTPLHYAGQYGLKDVVLVLLSFLKKHQLVASGVPIDYVDVWGDHDGLTPLHLAIIGHHPVTATNLVEALAVPLLCPQLLLLAARSPLPALIDCLVGRGGIDVNYTDVEHHRETALYTACKLNHYDVAEHLLSCDADPQIGELVFGWTPIFIAANEGYVRVVKLLLEFGASIDVGDNSGWLPMEHACLRGHLEIADLLRPQDPRMLLYDMYRPENNSERLAPPKSPELYACDDAMKLLLLVDILPEHLRTAYNHVYQQLRKPRKQAPPIKLFGHRYLADGSSMVLITLGSCDSRNQVLPVQIKPMLLLKTFATELDTALLLLVLLRLRLSNRQIGEAEVIDLPLDDLHGSATDPISFSLPPGHHPDECAVVFDLVPTYQYPHKKNKVFGRATALLKLAYTLVGPHLRSLAAGITAPIVDKALLDVLGEVHFEYLPVYPFAHPSMNVAHPDTYWKQLVLTRVIGHRGLGKNFNRQLLQLGENTVELFIAAASLGAAYVEFDVQLTKDLVPVVYHDFTVAEAGADIPMSSLTLEQFLGLQEDKHEAPRATRDDAAVVLANRPRLYPLAPNFHPKRSQALEDAIDREFRDQISRRMRLTRTWKNQGFKGNARGLSVALSFVTLKELFTKIPSNVGFNIELKYPMLDEAEAEGMGELAVDLNTYVDTILKVIYDGNTAGRDILFSSFHPDVCVLLSLKQPTIPILYLTEAGTTAMYDVRALLLQAAIRFAKKWNLLGIVSAAQALVKCPRLTQVVKLLGLVCVTYGVENNDPELAKIQMKAGVDAVIADSVLAVREGIREENDSREKILETHSGNQSPEQTC